MLNPEAFEVLTFDCYGTLIDWETGLFGALQPILAARAKSLAAADLLELYGEFEAEAEASPYRSYRDVLSSVVTRFGQHLGFTPTRDEVHALAASLPGWQPWPDTVAALQSLQRRYLLAIISNTDDDLFAATGELLEVRFAHVITAQQASCYKPGLEIFRKALAEISVPASRILHVGQSIYHDVLPAQALGLSTVWINRPSPRKNVGAVRKAEGAPDLEVADMKSLANALLGSKPPR
jgi:2-haloacid dehalogenase